MDMPSLQRWCATGTRHDPVSTLFGGFHFPDANPRPAWHLVLGGRAPDPAGGFFTRGLFPASPGGPFGPNPNLGKRRGFAVEGGPASFWCGQTDFQTKPESGLHVISVRSGAGFFLPIGENVMATVRFPACGPRERNVVLAIRQTDQWVDPLRWRTRWGRGQSGTEFGSARTSDRPHDPRGMARCHQTDLPAPGPKRRDSRRPAYDDFAGHPTCYFSQLTGRACAPCLRHRILAETASGCGRPCNAQWTRHGEELPQRWSGHWQPFTRTKTAGCAR